MDHEKYSEIIMRMVMPQSFPIGIKILRKNDSLPCLLYTSDAADDSLRVDLGGRRIIKKKFFQAEDGIRD